MRTPSLLIEVVGRFPQPCREMISERPLLEVAEIGNEVVLREALKEEEESERENDRKYWEPLKEILSQLRQGI